MGLKVLVFAMDDKTHHHLTTNYGGTDSNFISLLWRNVNVNAHSKDHVSLKQEEGAARFRSKAFNAIVTRKKAATLAVMQLGYDLMFADTGGQVPLPSSSTLLLSLLLLSWSLLPSPSNCCTI